MLLILNCNDIIAENYWTSNSEENLRSLKKVGRSPSITNEQFNEVIARCVSRILAVFDDSVQFGLVNLRLGEIKTLSVQ